MEASKTRVKAELSQFHRITAIIFRGQHPYMRVRMSCGARARGSSIRGVQKPQPSRKKKYGGTYVRTYVRACVRACVVRACRICIMCTYCVCICTCRKEKLHAAPYPSLSGSYRGYTIIMRTLSFFVSTRCLCFSSCICKRLPVFN